jgi:hypothetical protein
LSESSKNKQTNKKKKNLKKEKQAKKTKNKSRNIGGPKGQKPPEAHGF